jgi:hypothetical protein
VFTVLIHGCEGPLIEAGVFGYVVKLRHRIGLFPQVFCAVTQIAGLPLDGFVLMKLLTFTVIDAVPCPLTMVMPGGTVQLYCCTVLTGVTEYVTFCALHKPLVGPLMTLGVAGSLSTTIVICMHSVIPHVPPSART